MAVFRVSLAKQNGPLQPIVYYDWNRPAIKKKKIIFNQTGENFCLVKINF